MAMSATIHAHRTHTHISNRDLFVFMHFNVDFFLFVRSLLSSSIVFHKLKSKNHLLLLLHYIFLQLVSVCCIFFNSSLFVEKYVDTSFRSFILLLVLFDLV